MASSADSINHIWTKSHSADPALTTHDIPLWQIVEIQRCLHFPALPAADCLPPVDNLPAVGTTSIVSGPDNYALHMEWMAAIRSYCCFVVKADRTLATALKLRCLWEPAVAQSRIDKTWSRCSNVEAIGRGRYNLLSLRLFSLAAADNEDNQATAQRYSDT